MSEYIKIDKQFILTNINNDKLRVWLWILAKACDSSCVIDGVKLRRGQLLLSTREMEKVLGISRMSSRTICSKLEKEGAIERIPLSGKTTIVTVNNYDDYEVTHFQPTLNTDNQNDTMACNPLLTHFKEKVTHQSTHSNVCNTTSYDIEQPTYQPTYKNQQKKDEKERKKEKEKIHPHTPLLKEKEINKEKEEKKIVVVDNAHAREKRRIFFENIYQDLKSRDIWVEHFCSHNNITNSKFLSLLRESIEQIDFIGEQYENESEIKKHIISTINKKIKISNNGNKSKLSIQRRGMEPSAVSNEDYEGAF